MSVVRIKVSVTIIIRLHFLMGKFGIGCTVTNYLNYLTNYYTQLTGLGRQSGERLRYWSGFRTLSPGKRLKSRSIVQSSVAPCWRQMAATRASWTFGPAMRPARRLSRYSSETAEPVIETDRRPNLFPACLKTNCHHKILKFRPAALILGTLALIPILGRKACQWN